MSDLHNSHDAKYDEELATEYDAVRDRIFSTLKTRHISQKDFAKALHVPAQTITDWKKGKSRSFAQKLKAISLILNVSTSWLFLGTNEPPEHFIREGGEISPARNQLWGESEPAEQKDGPSTISDAEAALNEELISRLCRLTPDEISRVDAFVQGILATR